MVAFLIIHCSYSYNVAVTVCVRMSCAINDIFLNLIFCVIGDRKVFFFKGSTTASSGLFNSTTALACTTLLLVPKGYLVRDCLHIVK